MEEKFITKGVVVFANLIEPKIFLNGDSKYSIRILLSKSDLKSYTKLQQQYQIGLQAYTNHCWLIQMLKMTLFIISISIMF